MRVRPVSGVLAVVAAASVATLAGPRALHGQARGRVITPPKASDTARTQPGTAPAPATAPRPAGTIARSPVLDSIREAVFRNLLERDRTGLSTLASALCLGLSSDDFKKPGQRSEQVDPPNAMVQRLFTQRVPARSASGCTFGTASAAGRPVAGRPLLYSVGAVTELASGRYEVGAGYFYDGAGRGGYTFTVEQSDSGWVVKQWRLEWTAAGP